MMEEIKKNFERIEKKIDILNEKVNELQGKANDPSKNERKELLAKFKIENLETICFLGKMRKTNDGYIEKKDEGEEKKEEDNEKKQKK